MINISKKLREILKKLILHQDSEQTILEDCVDSRFLRVIVSEKKIEAELEKMKKKSIYDNFLDELNRFSGDNLII